jgi:hypothetical protein
MYLIITVINDNQFLLLCVRLRSFVAFFGSFPKKSCKNEATYFATSFLRIINYIRKSRIIMSSDIGN